LAAGANTSAMPVPDNANGATKAEQATCGPISAAIQATPTAWIASPAAISGRGPMRSGSTPANCATSIGIAVHGSGRSRACSGDRPCAVWKNCASRKTDPKAPSDMASDTPLVALNARGRNSRSGSIGAAARRSQARNAVSSGRW
jgi:hypothetical protein